MHIAGRAALALGLVEFLDGSRDTGLELAAGADLRPARLLRPLGAARWAERFRQAAAQRGDEAADRALEALVQRLTSGRGADPESAADLTQAR